MIAAFNWLALVAFAAASIPVARWVVRQSYRRWSGPDTAISRGFLYVLTLAATAGISFVAASVLYYEILYQPEFMQLAGPSGAFKFLLIFAGVWYAALIAFNARPGREG